MTRGPWLPAAVLSIFAVYLVSGANGAPFVHLRRLTSPWYGSYERTAWVAVPFLVLLAALPISGLLLRGRQRDLAGSASLVGASVLMIVLAWQGGNATLTQLRKGVAENQVAGPGSERVFQRAEALASGDGLILSQQGDGSLYAFMYDGVHVTNGGYDRDGHPSPSLSAVLSGVRDLCGVSSVASTLEQEHVRGFLFGTRQIAWGPPQWSEDELRHLPGTAVVAQSRDLFLLRPDLDRCP